MKPFFKTLFVFALLLTQSCAILDEPTTYFLQYKLQKLLHKQGVEYNPGAGEFKGVVENKKVAKFWRNVFTQKGKIYWENEEILLDFEHYPADSAGYTMLHIKQFLLKDTVSSYINKEKMRQIKAHIETQLKEKVPQIQTIDWWNNQVDESGEHYPINYPACFISIDADYKPVSKGVQNADILITLHLFSEVYADANGVSTLDESYDLAQKIYLGLQGTEGQNFSPLIRQSQKADDKYTNIHKINLVFSCQLQDNDLREATYVRAYPKLKIERRNE